MTDAKHDLDRLASQRFENHLRHQTYVAAGQRRAWSERITEAQADDRQVISFGGDAIMMLGSCLMDALYIQWQHRLCLNDRVI